MWPSTLYPERTYRFFKNVYDNYGSGSRGDKKSHQSGRLGLEQQHQSASTPSSGASTPQLERRGLGSHHSHPHHPHHPFHHPRHSLPSPPLSIFSSSSSDLAGGNSGPSTPSSSFRFGLQHHNNQRTPPPPPMTRLFAYSKSVATDMKHRFHAHIARLPKIESTEDSSNSDDQVSIDSRGDMMAQSAVDHHPHHHRHHHPHQLSPPGRGENIGGHQPLYYRSSSPVFGQRQMYAASTRLHHSEPQSATGSVPLTRQRPLCDHSVEHQQQHQQQQHFLHSDNSSSGPCQRSSPSSMSPNGKSAAAAALSARRLSSSVYRSALANTGRAATYDTDALGGGGCRPMLSAAVENGTRTVLLDKFASNGDVHNRAVGGLTLCGGREVGLTSIYISRVAANSAAEKCGLGAGDQILSANYISFLPSSSSAESTADGGLAPNSNSPSSSLPITCKRAYEILDNGGSESILLTVLPRSKAFPPARRRQHHLFAWVDAEDGRPVSPPPPDLPESLHLRHSSSPEVLDANIISSGSRRAPRLADLHRVGNHFNSTTLNPFSLPSTTASSSSFVDAEKIRGVTLTLEKDVELGLVIRGGIEFGLGIYVARVQADSLADQAGLRVGDQILSLNGQDFGGLLHDEAVDMLASAATLNMSVLYVGKVPSMPHFFSSSPLMEHHPHHHQQHPPLVGNWPPPPPVSAGNSAVISPRHSPHHRGSYYPPPPPSAGEMVASGYGSTSPTNKPPSPRLIRQSPHHHRMTPLSHSNSSPTSSASSSSAHHHQHEALHHSHSYREQCSTNLGRYEKRDTPTLLITDSDNRNLPHHLHQQQQQQLHPHHHPHPHHLIVDDDEEGDIDVRNVVVDDDEDDDELYVLTVDRAFSATSGMGSVGSGRRFSLRKRLLNSKSEEDEMTLDEEAAKYLTEKERLSLAYYRNEYETKAMPVETMVALLSELFDNEEKYSLLFRLYHVIRPEDVDRFDELLYNRELLAAVKNKYLSGSGKYRHLFKQQSTDSGDGAPHYQVGDPTVGQSTAGAIPLMQRPPPEHLAQQQQQQQQQQQLAHLHRHSIVSSHGQDTRIDLSALDENDDDEGGDERRRRQQQQHQYHLDLQQQQHENTMAAVNSRLGRRESALLVHRSAGSVNSNKVPSPNSAAYRKTFMTRRHSSGTSDTPIVRDTSPAGHCVNSSGGVVSGGGVGSVNPLAPTAFHHHHGSYPLVADERRWSIANPAESTSCRRPSSLFNPSDLRLRRSPSPSVTFAQQNPQQQHRSSREELEVPNSSASSSSQRISLSRKGSNSSQCCLQETIPEHEDGHLLEAPNTPTIANNATTSTLASASGPLRGSGNHLHVPPINGVGGGGGGDEGDGSESDDSASGGAGGGLFSGHLRVRRHRSLPSPTFTTEKLLASNFPQHQRSNSFRLPSHRATSEPNGRWRIKVKKSRPFLGIVIEGGDNVTTQTQPRIISIHQSGAAIECGDLHVGHIILEIDGHSTEDMNHAQVAQAISRAYYNTPHKDYIEFLVREKSRAEFDLRRSSFMLLNNSFE